MSSESSADMCMIVLIAKRPSTFFRSLMQLVKSSSSSRHSQDRLEFLQDLCIVSKYWKIGSCVDKYFISQFTKLFIELRNRNKTTFPQNMVLEYIFLIYIL